MERKEVRLGPGAASLLLVVVVVTMAILGLLTMLQVRNDMQLTNRSSTMIEARYEAMAHTEKDLMALDEALMAVRKQQLADDEAFYALLADSLPDGMQLEDTTVCWSVPVNDAADLLCAVSVHNTDTPDRLQWVQHMFESHIGGEMIE